MPEKQTIERAKEDAREGKAPSTQAGEFVREEIHHIRAGKHGARSAKQAIAIGLSKARNAGVKLPARDKKKTSTRKKRAHTKPSAKRSRAMLRVVKNESRSAGSHQALSTQAHRAAVKRGTLSRHRAALKAVRTKGHEQMSQAARKAAKTRKRAA
jgi:hypothetical protein